MYPRACQTLLGAKSVPPFALSAPAMCFQGNALIKIHTGKICKRQYKLYATEQRLNLCIILPTMTQARHEHVYKYWCGLC